MHEYQYTYGDRPLEGFAIQRAIGRGGFGEVYYALSDSGREVALKVIGGYEQIELRGVSQCMNLKSPHLVTIFDIKQNAKGRPFVVMEYIAGPSLRDLIEDVGGGLGVAKAAYFLQEIAKGLSFLHAAGIVHRDLKPGNIFYEDGYVKIGDYGLSKAIAPSQHEGQTITVGTVHYMAPEIGAGCYDRSIDIYALGIILYEMLTGRVPYSGDSHGEILMKHMMGDPDLSGIDEPMVSAIRKALTKDPAERYQTVQELVEDVVGAEHVRTSMSGFRPESLSMVAGRAARDARLMPPPPPALRPPIPLARPATPVPSRPPTTPRPVHNASPVIAADPLPQKQRIVLGIVAMLIVSIGTCLLAQRPFDKQITGFAFVALMIAGGTFGLMAAWRWLRLQTESGLFIRLVYGGIAGAAGCLAASPVLHDVSGRYEPMARQTFLAILAATLVIDWRARMLPTRWQRVSLTLAFTAGLCAFVAALILDAQPAFVIGAVAGISLVAQAITPVQSGLRSDSAGPTGGESPPQENPPPAHRLSSAPPNVSPYSRRVAFIVCSLGICLPVWGLQRFYVGKIGTGILWLLTFGLFGIGQLIDLILIASGHFTDRDGRLLQSWQPRVTAAIASGAPAASSVAAIIPPIRRRPVSVLLSSLGGLLVILTLLLGLAVAIGLPEMIHSGVFGNDVAGEVDRAFGSSGDWADVLSETASLITVWIGLAAASLLVVARRNAGFGHVLRAIVACAGLCVGILALTDGGEHIPWPQIAEHWNQGRVGAGIERILNSGRLGPYAIIAAVAFAVSATLLAWPAPVQVTPQNNGGSTQ